MAKKVQLRSQRVGIKKKITNSAEPIQNGLTEAVLGFNPGFGSGVELSQTTGIFKNLRWYMVSNMRQPLSQAYVEIGIVRTVTDVPVDDAFRGGWEIKSEILSAEELTELQFTVEQEDDVGTMSEAKKWERLFGGSGVIIITDQDMETPLDIESIKEGDKVAFKAVDMWELFWDKQNTEGDGEPLDNENFEFYRYYSHNIHKSRVLVFKGIKAPSFVRPRLRGWGMSVVEVLIRSINQYLKANDLTFEVLDEFKIDIYKIKNLTNTLLSAKGDDAIRKRVQLANFQKNYQNAITMDSEDDFSQKELSFQGIAETMTSIRMQVASDLRMPLTKVFGISAAGFSSGEDDIENYNSMVESTIRSKSKHQIITMMKLRCAQLFGYIPEDLTIEFKPLRVLSSEQEENVKNSKFARLMQAVSAGHMAEKEFKDAVNKENLLSIKIDSSLDKLEVEQPDEGGDAPKEGKKSSTQAPIAKNSIMNPGDVDEAVWKKAKEACEKEYGKIDYAIVMGIYKKMKGIK